ncbi:MAG: cysteine desulfurase-like protein [Saprospiraceae bacterium]
MLQEVKSHFTALKQTVGSVPVVFLDGPAGTQVPDRVIEDMVQYYHQSNANTHGQFANAQETDEMMHQTRKDVASFLNASGPDCISFGQNMTTLSFSLARAFSRIFKPGDEVLITQLDHEANRGPWLTLRDVGVKVREIKLLPSGILDYDDFHAKLNDRTRLVCVGGASNFTGTVNDLQQVRQATYQSGAWMLVDAVHYAPHFLIDVAALGCDFLLCSAYKFYGPHVGILYAKDGLLSQLPTDRLRTQDPVAPYRIETGTLNHAAIAGVQGAIRWMASWGDGHPLREQLAYAFQRIRAHERQLARKLYNGLLHLPGITVIGPDLDVEMRAPTLSFFHHDLPAETVCHRLGEKGIFAWDGHFYAIRAAETLGLLERGGVTRMGISMYTEESDIDRTLDVLADICR